MPYVGSVSLHLNGFNVSKRDSQSPTVWSMFSGNSLRWVNFLKVKGPREG